MADPRLHLDDLLPESPLRLRPGDVLHSHVNLSIPTSPTMSLIVRPGSTFTVTEGMLELSIDRNGWSWLTLVDDLDAQVARYGRVRIARGPAPAGLLPERNTADWDIAAEEAHAAARALPDPDERAEAVRRATATFGPAGPGSRTLAVYAEHR